MKFYIRLFTVVLITIATLIIGISNLDAARYSANVEEAQRLLTF